MLQYDYYLHDVLDKRQGGQSSPILPSLYRLIEYGYHLKHCLKNPFVCSTLDIGIDSGFQSTIGGLSVCGVRSHRFVRSVKGCASIIYLVCRKYVSQLVT